LACPLPLPEEQIISHTAYLLSYNEEHEQANWVAYMLTSSKLGSGLERSNRFLEDPLVASGTATNADYAKSGYDRGHLAPAADMSWSMQVMQESFYYSNMSPQLPGFNRGIWKKLEEKVRDWAAVRYTLCRYRPYFNRWFANNWPQPDKCPKAILQGAYCTESTKRDCFFAAQCQVRTTLVSICIVNRCLRAITAQRPVLSG
jgi:hypothetical protein